MITVLVTGGFDPLHSGHLSYFRAARELGDYLVVGVNSDEWLAHKKGKPFMPLHERIEVVKHLWMVDEVIPVIDDEEGGTTRAIDHLLLQSPKKLIVANGGDRVDGEIPEQRSYADHPDVHFVFGVGGVDKKNSSSLILEDWSTELSQDLFSPSWVRTYVKMHKQHEANRTAWREREKNLRALREAR